jgi:hypothetical protein
MSQTQWKRGDRLVHASRPEWGVGEVTSAQPGDGNGQQTLTIRFTRAGAKTLSTAHAPLELAEDVPILEKALAERAGWSDQSAAVVEEVMTAIPERARDPFTSLTDRLRFTLDLYRFTDTGAPLIDWAAAQSGLPDPLSRFNRHELEQFFRKFRMNLDAHLRTIADQARQSDQALFDQAAAEAPPEARFALKRIHARR